MQNQDLTKSQLKSSLFLKVQLKYLETKHGIRFVKCRTLCPFHEETSPSMSQYIDKSGVVRFHCFGCNVNEDFFGMIGRLGNQSSFNANFSKFKEFVDENRKWGTIAKHNKSSEEELLRSQSV